MIKVLGNFEKDEIYIKYKNHKFLTNGVIIYPETKRVGIDILSKSNFLTKFSRECKFYYDKFLLNNHRISFDSYSEQRCLENCISMKNILNKNIFYIFLEYKSSIGVLESDYELNILKCKIDNVELTTERCSYTGKEKLALILYGNFI